MCLQTTYPTLGPEVQNGRQPAGSPKRWHNNNRTHNPQWLTAGLLENDTVWLGLGGNTARVRGKSTVAER